MVRDGTPTQDPTPETAAENGASEVPAAPEVGRTDDVPMGVQLAWRLRALIRSGRLAAGARLPGVRELAAGAGVNVNTARAVYRRLEREELVTSRQGMGTFVVEHPSVSPVLEQLAAETAETAGALGLDPRELARTIYTASEPESSQADFEQLTDPGRELSESEQRAARQSLRAQIARLEADLAAYPDAERKPAGPRWPTVADIADLEAVRDDLVEQVKQARRAAANKSRREGAARAELEEMVAEPEAHKFEAISNEDLGEPGCKHYQVRPAWGPVGALMNWWRVKISSGCP